MSAGRPAAPSWRLKRGPWRAAELVALDFEATGLDFERDTVISFGAVPIRAGRIDVGDSVYQLVDPGELQPSRDSIAVHGLRPLDLADAPSLESAKESLGTAIQDRFLVTWWAPVEAAFLDKLFGGGTTWWLRRTLDVRNLMLCLEGGRGDRITLAAAAGRYGVPVASPHHALDDAFVTAQLFLMMAAKLRERAASVRDLQRLRPAPLRPPTAL